MNVIEKLKEFNKKIMEMTPEEVSQMFDDHPVDYIEGQYDRLLDIIKGNEMTEPKQQVLLLDGVWMPLVADSLKTSSIRVGTKKLNVGPCIIKSTTDGEEIHVEITSIQLKSWVDINPNFIEANEGLTKKALGCILEHYYETPMLNYTSVTVIEFHVMESNNPALTGTDNGQF